MTENVHKTIPTHQSKKQLLKLLTNESEQHAVVSQDRKNHIVEVRSLLSELVNTTAAVLTSRPVHVWQVYGGFHRIYEAVLHIFYHGCVQKDTQGNSDIWPFIVGLRVFSPVLGPSSEVATVPCPAEKWIHSSLQKLQLAAKIAALTAEKEHVEKHYYPWALFRSLPHITAVKTCLKALEENSQDGLADIDPKLLVGEYCPPPGTKVVSHPNTTKLSKLKSQLYDPGLSKVSLIDSTVSHQRNAASLPTSPLAEKDWIPAWPYDKQNTVLKGQKLGAPCKPTIQGVTQMMNYSDGSTDKLKERSHQPIKRGKSEASLKIIQKDLYNPYRRPFEITDMDEQSSSLMSRESPDGSSGSSDWPLTSPVSQPVPFIKKDSPHISSTSSSPIAKLVKGETLSRHETGARPKEYYTTPQLKNQPIPHYHLDVSDSSEPGSSISPSLLQVNYGGKHSTSDDASISYDTPGTGGGLEIKTPQLRRRSSSGRLGSTHADSDQDSEETVDGGTPQGSRRRRRPTVSQHRSGLSVKLLVDSRGVLGSETDKYSNVSKNQPKNLTRNHSSHSKVRDPNLEIGQEDSSVSSPSPINSDFLSSSTQPASGADSKPVKTESIATPVPSTLRVEIMNTLATSAPGTIMKSTDTVHGETAKILKKTHSRSRSDGAQEVAGKLKLASSNTAPSLEMGMKLGDDSVFGSQIRKRFMDDGGHSITPAADYGVSPRPQPGQSLIGFLSSKDKPYAELDRENAHFNISEAVIAALTQMQFDTWKGKIETNLCTADESDEEIRILEARIREKRMLKLKGSASCVITAKSANSEAESTSDPQRWVHSHPLKVESTTDYSMYESPQSSAYNSESDLLSELEEEEHPVIGVPIPVPLSRQASSDQPSVLSDFTSAESVAINLLKHFSEQKLPKASELDWLVSEQDVPQKLLPLPTSVAVSPDDISSGKQSELQMQLRGTMDWAPPRPQLILTLHTNTKRSLLMGMQRWRCAGCGMRVSESLSRHFRLCHYLGRYFCTTCHRNQTAMIPAKVLHKWDFKLYPVASFSSELLERMKIDPLINVGALNPRLYKKCRHLHQTHIYRLQLYHTLPYINTCSRALSEKMTLGKLPIHWASDPHVYSLDDLESIRAGLLVDNIKDVTLLCIRHISKCEVCLGRGFICEICCRGEAIFPFQLDSTALCEICSACFHSGCFSPTRCPRCIRRESRRMSRDMIIEKDSFESSVEKES